jgi:hypothetical protein
MHTVLTSYRGFPPLFLLALAGERKKRHRPKS